MARSKTCPSLLAMMLTVATATGLQTGCDHNTESASKLLTAVYASGWDREKLAQQLKLDPQALAERMRANKVCIDDRDCVQPLHWTNASDPQQEHNAERCVQRHEAAPWAVGGHPKGDCRTGAPAGKWGAAYYCDAATGRWKERLTRCATTFDSWLTLGGKVVRGGTLNAGREAYMLYCRPCHGARGDGKGPAGAFLRPPPRDLRIATYKFAGVVDGLPHDEDLERIITKGLWGTAMLPWDIPDAEVAALVQYIKTFSPHDDGWRTTDPDFELGKRVVPPPDPWQDPAKAISRGKVLYNAHAMCWSCHPSYSTPKEIYEDSVALVKEKRRPEPLTSFRPALYLPEAKPSPAYKVNDVEMRILPPDFLSTPVRSLSARSLRMWQSHTAPREADDPKADLFRIVGAGIPGTAIPPWYGALPDEDIWAIVHYVDYLIDLKDTAEADALLKRLHAAPAFAAPAATAAEAKTPAAATPAPAPPAK